MPRLRRPQIASAEQVRITRDGDYAIIEYADPKVATTNFKLGEKKLASMTDAEVLAEWNEYLAVRDEFMAATDLPTIEIPAGKPQVAYSARSDQWVPRGDVVRCVVINAPRDMDDVFVAIDDRDFTLAEFVKMVCTFEGWGMRIEFVDYEEVHVRPDVEVREPDPDE